jgi:hypothetical protein
LVGGETLKPTATGFDLDLSRPGQHKTSAAFGPTITTVPAPAAALLTAWLGSTGRTGTSSAAQPYVFVPGTDASKPLGAPQWTKLVKAVFKAHAGVPLAPNRQPDADLAGDVPSWAPRTTLCKTDIRSRPLWSHRTRWWGQSYIVRRS